MLNARTMVQKGTTYKSALFEMKNGNTIEPILINYYPRAVIGVKYNPCSYLVPIIFSGILIGRLSKPTFRTSHLFFCC